MPFKYCKANALLLNKPFSEYRLQCRLPLDEMSGLYEGWTATVVSDRRGSPDSTTTSDIPIGCVFFEAWPGLTSSGRFESFFYGFRNKSFAFLIVPEQPVLIQNRSGSIVRKPGVVGETSGVSQSDVLFTIDGFRASW